MQISAEPKGWSDAEVDQVIDSLIMIETKLSGISNWTYTLMDGTNMLVFLFATVVGYTISQWYLPATTDIGKW